MGDNKDHKYYGAKALIPIIVFLGLYVGCGVAFTILGAEKPFNVMPRYVAVLAGVLIGLICFEKDRDLSIPNFVIHEHHVYNLQKFNRELCIYDDQPVNGKYKVPDRPGLGNELSDYALTHCDKVEVK